MGSSNNASHVSLVIPARSRFLRLARLTAAGISTDLGFTVQDVEDVRVAVDEACALLIESCSDATHGDEHRIELEYTVAGDKLVIEGLAPCGGGAALDMHPVARELLDMTADEHDVFTTERGRGFRLLKHRQRSTV